jgi:hypothetical protein
MTKNLIWFIQLKGETKYSGVGSRVPVLIHGRHFLIFQWVALHIVGTHYLFKNGVHFGIVHIMFKVNEGDEGVEALRDLETVVVLKFDKVYLAWLRRYDLAVLDYSFLS